VRLAFARGRRACLGTGQRLASEPLDTERVLSERWLSYQDIALRSLGRVVPASKLCAEGRHAGSCGFVR